MPKLTNLRLGGFKLPGHGRIKKGQTVKVSAALIANGRIANLISRGKLSVVKDEEEILMPLARPEPVRPEEPDTEPAPPVPAPEPEPEPTPEPEPEPEVKGESEPIIKRKRGRRKKTEDSSEA